MTGATQQIQDNIIIRTMKGDLAAPAPTLPAPVPTLPSVEAKSQAPNVPSGQEIKGDEMPKAGSISASGRPVIVQPKIIPPKAFPKPQIKPLFRTTPTWIKIGAIGLVVLAFSLTGLYSYWKIFIQSKTPAVVANRPASTTAPVLPTAPEATTAAPIKFFNKLPNKSVTIDLPSKTVAVLNQALKSEAELEEARSSVKRINITYKGKPITTEEFFNLMPISAPKDFLLNYENEFALAFFGQKEGARPILILKSKDKMLTENQMADWEKNTFADNILPLFFAIPDVKKYPPEFKSYFFVDQLVRYLNVSIPRSSLNYAIRDNFLIITTSSTGMFVILQDLTGGSVSQNYLDNLNASIIK